VHNVEEGSTLTECIVHNITFRSEDVYYYGELGSDEYGDFDYLFEWLSVAVAPLAYINQGTISNCIVSGEYKYGYEDGWLAASLCYAYPFVYQGKSSTNCLFVAQYCDMKDSGQNGWGTLESYCQKAPENPDFTKDQAYSEGGFCYKVSPSGVWTHDDGPAKFPYYYASGYNGGIPCLRAFMSSGWKRIDFKVSEEDKNFGSIDPNYILIPRDFTNYTVTPSTIGDGSCSILVASQFVTATPEPGYEFEKLEKDGTNDMYIVYFKAAELNLYFESLDDENSVYKRGIEFKVRPESYAYEVVPYGDKYFYSFDVEYGTSFTQVDTDCKGGWFRFKFKLPSSQDEVQVYYDYLDKDWELNQSITGVSGGKIQKDTYVTFNPKFQDFKLTLKNNVETADMWGHSDSVIIDSETGAFINDDYDLTNKEYVSFTMKKEGLYSFNYKTSILTGLDFFRINMLGSNIDSTGVKVVRWSAKEGYYFAGYKCNGKEYEPDEFYEDYGTIKSDIELEPIFKKYVNLKFNNAEDADGNTDTGFATPSVTTVNNIKPTQISCE